MIRHCFHIVLVFCTFLSTGVYASQDLKEREVLNLLVRMETEINRHYIVADRKQEIRSLFHSLSSHDSLASMKSAAQVAERVNTGLKVIDRHFGVKWNDAVSTSAGSEPNWFDKLARENSGFTRVEIFENNIGYIHFWGFDQVNSRSKTIVKDIMNKIKDTDSLIFDLRDNGGGSDEMVRHIAGYLFDKPTHLTSTDWHQNGFTSQAWSDENDTGIDLSKKKVWILVGPETFSAAEAFTFSLQRLHRATVVGAQTKGGAHRWQPFTITGGFTLFIPIARTYSAKTGEDWDRIGVTPDVVTATDKALAIAIAQANSAQQ